MKQHRSNAVLKTLAKEKLEGNFFNALVALFLVDILSQTIFSLVASLLPGGGLLWNVISIFISSLASVFLGILQTGITYYFLNLVCKRKYSLPDIFYGFREMPEKSLKISLIQVALNTICMLPYQLCILMFWDTYQPLYLVAAGISLLIGYIVMIPVKLTVSQMYYLLLDFPESSVKEILLTSARIMKGHKLRLFWLELSFLPLQLLCILSFGIGFLWLNPYMRTTYTVFFLDLMTPDTPNSN